MFKTIAVITAAFLVAGTADAIPLSNTFTIDIYQHVGANGAQSQATEANLTAAGTTYLETITYTGDLWFETSDLTDATTIDDWLSTGGGSYTISAATGGRQLSKPFYGDGTATTTFFNIVGTFINVVDGTFDALIAHDDGISVFGNGVLLGAKLGPTAEVNTLITGFHGGEFRLIYAATNGDPSVLRVNSLPVVVEGQLPVPAGLPLLATALAGISFLRRRRT